jgi:predicted GTPase
MPIPLIPIAIGAAVATIIAYVAKSKGAEKPQVSPPSQRKRRSILERNLAQLRFMVEYSAGGKICVLGQPGAGKSALVDMLTERACQPRPKIGVGTNATDWASQLGCTMVGKFGNWVVVDCPGYGTGSHPTSTFVDRFPFDVFTVVVFVLNTKLRGADDAVAERLRRLSGPALIVVRNMVDGIESEDETDVQQDLRNRHPHLNANQIMFTSCRDGRGIAELRRALVEICGAPAPSV